MKSRVKHKCNYISLVVMYVTICLLLSGCANSKNKKEFLDAYSNLMKEETTINKDDFSQLVHTYHKYITDIKEWLSDEKFSKEFYDITINCFDNNKDSGNCYIVFMVFSSMGVNDNGLKNAFEEAVQIYVGGDFDKAVSLHDDIKEFQQKQDDYIGFYGEIDYGVSKETWEKYDTSELTVDEIDQLNWDMRGISTTLQEKPITQHNIDITKKGMSFSDKLQLINTLESSNYTDFQVITADDIAGVLSKRIEPVYMEKNKGGYYDNHTIDREYHFNQTESQKDVITRDGKTGFANTLDVSYIGDFASHTYDIEYVDDTDFYKVKHHKVWEGYFRGCELDVDPVTFQKYNDFFYVEDENSQGETMQYLFASTGKVIDVYELDDVLLSDLVLEVVDAPKILARGFIISKEYDKAIALLEEMKEDKDSNDILLLAYYGYACDCIVNEEYEEAINIFENLGDYKDSAERKEKLEALIKEKDINEKITQKLEAGDYEGAITEASAVEDPEKAEQLVEGIKDKQYDKAIDEMGNGNNDTALELLNELNGYKDSKELAESIIYGQKEEQYQKAITLVQNGHNPEAIEILEQLGDYKDSIELLGILKQASGLDGQEEPVDTETYSDLDNINNNYKTVEMFGVLAK